MKGGEVMQKYDYSKLLGRMRERGETQDSMAAKIKISACSMNQKLNNKSDFKQSEIYNISGILGIPLADVQEYFFAHML